ncbi:MAG: hypothetical protein IKG55_03015 [Solobacterium sp.]|nr:hypothetical protein [Solobacterium sp.]
MIRAAAAALLAGSLLSPLSPQSRNTVSLHVDVRGCDLSQADTAVSLIDLDDGSVREEKVKEGAISLDIEKGGEYILSLKNCPAGFMPEEEILITKAQSQRPLEKVFTLKPFEVRIYQYVDDTDLFAPGGKLELRDESDETVFEFEPDEEGFIKDEEGNEFAFEAGRSYVLSQKDTAQGYEDTGDLLLLIPEFMEEDKPLEFSFFLKETDGLNQPYIAPALSENEYIRVPSVIHQPQLIEETAEEAEIPQELEEIQPAETVSYSASQPFVIPEIYLPRPEEKKESRKIESNIGRTGFIVRLFNEKHEYLKGAKIAVYDQNQNLVDEWLTENEDHLVNGDKIKASETYTVHLAKEAEGYAGSVVDIQHTASVIHDENYPLIELIDRPEKAAALPTEKTETVKKAVNWAAGASAAAAAAILGTIGAVFVFGRKTR